MNLAVHPLSENPTAAWEEISQKQKVVKINARTPNTEAPSDKVDLQLSINIIYIINKYQYSVK